MIRRRQQQAGKDLDSDYGHEDDLGGVLKHGSCVASRPATMLLVIAIRDKGATYGATVVTRQESTRQELTRFGQNPGHRFTQKEMATRW